MALPVLNAPTYELTLSSSGETIQYRPFLVKEEKILLMALESGDEKEMMRSMKQIISSCVMGEVDIEKLPLFDIQYLFLNIRSQSVGEKSILRFKHPDELNSNNEKCEHIQDVEIDLKGIKPEQLPGHNKKIDLTSDIGLTMSYPGFDMYDKIISLQDESALDVIFDIVSESIEMIYKGDEIFYAEDHSKEDLIEFLNSLSTLQFNKIRNFFQTMPYLRHEFDYTCEKCGCKEHVVLTGIEDFFA